MLSGSQSHRGKSRKPRSLGCIRGGNKADEANQLVRRAIAARGWKLVEQTPPGGRICVGHFDAIDRWIIMGFPADVTIRMRPLAGQTRVDVRSVSRVGRHDYGSNAQRIEKFAAEIQAQLDAAK